MEADELLAIKKRIEQRKENLQNLKGKEQLLLEQLKEKYGCTTIKEAIKELSRLSKNTEKLKTLIDNGITQLCEEYDL